MKFDPDKPHGTIVGHDKAVYEQDGILFDGTGRPVDHHVDDSVNVDPPSTVNESQIVDAADCLKEILKDGPVTLFSIKKQSEQQNHRWDTMKLAFTHIGAKELKRGNSMHWYIPKRGNKV